MGTIFSSSSSNSILTECKFVTNGKKNPFSGSCLSSVGQTLHFCHIYALNDTGWCLPIQKSTNANESHVR